MRAGGEAGVQVGVARAGGRLSDATPRVALLVGIAAAGGAVAMISVARLRRRGVAGTATFAATGGFQRRRIAARRVARCAVTVRRISGIGIARIGVTPVLVTGRRLARAVAAAATTFASHLAAVGAGVAVAPGITGIGRR